MRLDHEFTVPAPPEQVWKAVTDPESVAPCMPGATLTKVDGDTFTGNVKVKLGPISLLYKGSGEFLETDEQARKIVIKASGKDARGSGTAAATVTVTLTEEAGSTKGKVSTDLNVTGRPAQFGRGMISEVGGKILDQFAANLAQRLGAQQPETAEEKGAAAKTAEKDEKGTAATGAAKGTTKGTEESTDKPAAKAESAKAAGEPARPKLEAVKSAPQGQPQAEAIDLFDYAGSSVAKRLAPPLAAIAVLLVILRIIRARRRS